MAQWCIIPEFPNYKISTDSVVVNIVTGKKVSVSMHKHGYRVVRLWKNNTTKLCKIYRLKSICFIPNPENKPEVNHLDGDRLNEDLSNFEWATPSENMKHAFITGLAKKQFKKGSEHQLRKLSISDIINIRIMRSFKIKLKDIANYFNITIDHTCRVSKHKQTIEHELQPE